MLLPHRGSFVTVKKFPKKNVVKDVLRRYMCILVDFDNFAFSKRKLCNGENFRIKDFDEFRCF